MLRATCFVASLLATLLLTPTASFAQGTQSLPQMVGTAEAPKSFQASTMTTPRYVAYVLTQTDRDTNLQGQVLIDMLCKVRPTSITSCSGAAATLRGVDAMGIYTWDVGGQAKTTAGRYVDSWQLYNDRIDTHPQYDVPFTVNQVITLTP